MVLSLDVLLDGHRQCLLNPLDQELLEVNHYIVRCCSIQERTGDADHSPCTFRVVLLVTILCLQENIDIVLRQAI